MKLLQDRLKQTQPLLPIRLHSKEYDSSQEALNKWLKENPLGQTVNGGKIENYTLDSIDTDQLKNLADFKLFQEVDKQMMHTI